jgi:DNA-binding response OmpR family regulator
MPEMRLAILDSDSGFVRVLVKRANDLGWQHRRLEAPPRTEDFVAMRVNALVVDLALLGPGAWEFLERVSSSLPGLGIVVCTGRSSVSQRVRGLRLGADDWVVNHVDFTPVNAEILMAQTRLGYVPTGMLNTDRWGTLTRLTKFTSRNAGTLTSPEHRLSLASSR